MFQDTSHGLSTKIICSQGSKFLRNILRQLERAHYAASFSTLLSDYQLTKKFKMNYSKRPPMSSVNYPTKI